VKKFTGTPIPVMVTGHSLGAAQATLYAYRMLKNCKVWLADDGKTPLCKLENVYTFCSPRVGNEAFTEIYNSVMEAEGIKVFRIVNGFDVVPMIPL
jgi:predicted lipase